MILYICNAFSLSMLDRQAQTGTPRGYVSIAADTPMMTARVPRPVEYPARFLDDFERYDFEIVSAVGHPDVARLISDVLCYAVDVNRIAIKLNPDDICLIGQYVGPRLAPGATELPKGAKLEWWSI